MFTLIKYLMKKPYLFINNKSYKRLTEAARVPLDSWARGSVPSRIIEEVEEEKEEFTRVENDKRKQSDSLQHE